MVNQLKQFEDRRTPFYAYRMDELDRVLKTLSSEAKRRGYHVHYALKANAHPKLLEKIVQYGLGADCVSGNEVVRALESGFAPASIAFAGVGKTDWEIRMALERKIFSINVESLEVLLVVDEIAKSMNRIAPIALRLNPDVDAKTHKYITTGLEENKFGIGLWQLETVLDQIQQSEHLQLNGLHFHIGSQIRSLEPFRNLCNRVNQILSRVEELGFQIKHINAGGGLGFNYDSPDAQDNPNFEAFFQVFDDYLNLRPGQELHFELGRSVIASCGDLISRVLYIKEGQKTNFMILDAGMTELIRPALYQSFHTIQNLSKSDSAERLQYDIVGPICESSDCFGKAVYMPNSERGDLIAIRSVGAYGESMASSYNLRDLNESVFID